MRYAQSLQLYVLGYLIITFGVHLHRKARKLPFFLYSYVDDDILVARGRSGGLALYARVDSDWQMSKGVAAVYK